MSVPVQMGRMSIEDAEAFADALHDYVGAIVDDKTADPSSSQSGFAEYHRRPHFIAALTGKSDDEGRHENPGRSRTVWIAGAVGGALVLGGLSWWIWRKLDKGPPKITGEVVCAPNPYTAPVHKGDYVVISLGTLDGQWHESTWAEVQAIKGTQLEVLLVGEETTDQLGPKILATDKHGFKLGDVLTIERRCILDRFRPGHTYNVVCGPALYLAGFNPIAPDQASLLGIGDRAQIVIRSAAEQTGAIWVTIDSVSAGVQTLRGQVNAVPSTDLGPKPGDVIDFLRDCVVDAEFGAQA